MKIMCIGDIITYVRTNHLAFSQFARSSLMELLHLSNVVDGFPTRWTKSAVDTGKVGV